MNVAYDSSDTATMADPLPVLRRLQNEDPLRWSPRLRAWIISRYRDVKKIQLNKDLSADRLAPFFDHPPRETKSMPVLSGR